MSKDVDAFLSRQSWLKARMMKMNIALAGAAIKIPANTRPISLEELNHNVQQKCSAIQVDR